MTIILTPEEQSLFFNNGYDKNSLKNITKSYRDNGLTDEQIRAKIDTKLNTLRRQTTSPDISDTSNTDRTVLQGGVEKKVDLRPSNIMNNIVDYSSAAITTPLNMLTKKNDLQTAYNEELQSSKDFRAEQAKKYPVWTNFENGVKDFAGYSVLPAARLFKGAGLLPKIGNAALTGGYQGGVIGGIDSLANKGDFLSGATEGAAVGGALGAVFPMAGKLTGKLIEITTGLKPATLKRAVQPDSKALDIIFQDEKEIDNVMYNLANRVREDYNQLLNKRGKAVGKQINNLKNKEDMFSVDELKNDITRVFNKKQRDKVNSVRNLTGNLEQDLYKEIDKAGNKEELINAFKNNIETQKYQGGNLDVQKGRVNNKFYTKTLNNENNAIELASRKFNEILDKIKKNPEILNNADEISKMEQELSQMSVPEDFANDMFNKFYETISNYNNIKNTVSPLSLQGIKETIEGMTDWSLTDKINKDYKNPVLKLIYGKYNRKLNRLAPELAEANKNYSDLIRFKRQKGLQNLLGVRGDLDKASSDLRFYKSTAQKGQKQKNLREFEKILTDNGYSPFLNEIDDFNAAQDLLLNLGTGRNVLGKNTLARLGTALGLRVPRALNRRPYLADLYKQLALSNNPELRIPLIYTLGDTIFEGDINEE